MPSEATKLVTMVSADAPWAAPRGGSWIDLSSSHANAMKVVPLAHRCTAVNSLLSIAPADCRGKVALGEALLSTRAGVLDRDRCGHQYWAQEEKQMGLLVRLP